MKKYRVTLTDEERQGLSDLISAGKAAARKLSHARILLKPTPRPAARPGPTDRDQGGAGAGGGGVGGGAERAGRRGAVAVHHGRCPDQAPPPLPRTSMVAHY